MIIDAYNTTQDVRGRSDYLTGARPGQAPPPYTPFDPRRILDRMDAAGADLAEAEQPVRVGPGESDDEVVLDPLGE